MSSALKKHFDASAARQASVEDLDPIPTRAHPGFPVVIEPDNKSALAVAQRYRELEYHSDALGQAELQSTATQLHKAHGLIAAANERGGLSAESAFFASVAVESLTGRLGLDVAPMIGSFESAINSEGKTTISLESLSEALEAVDHGGGTFLKRTAASFYRFLVPLWTMVKMSSRDIDEVLKKAGKLKKGVAGAKIEVKSHQIALGKGPSKNVPADLLKAAEILKYMVRDFGTQANVDFKSNLEAVEPMENAETVEQIFKSIPKVWAKFKDPRVKIGGKPADPLIGNWKLFEDHSLKYKGDDAILKKFDVYANHDYPTLVGFQGSDDSDAFVNKAIEIEALSPDEIVKIGEALKIAVANFGKWRAFVEHVSGATSLVALFGTASAFMTGPFAMVTFPVWLGICLTKVGNRQHYATGMNDLDAVYDALSTSNRMRLHVGYDSGRVLRETIKLYLRLAKASLKVHVTGSMESWDQATADNGVSVNETAANEPLQAPGKGDTAPTDEVIPKIETINDDPMSHQDLNGPVEPANESRQDRTTGQRLPYWFRPEQGTSDC